MERTNFRVHTIATLDFNPNWHVVVRPLGISILVKTSNVSAISNEANLAFLNDSDPNKEFSCAIKFISLIKQAFSSQLVLLD
jgi:hypothetical protein